MLNKSHSCHINCPQTDPTVRKVLPYLEGHACAAVNEKILGVV